MSPYSQDYFIPTWMAQRQVRPVSQSRTRLDAYNRAVVKNRAALRLRPDIKEYVQQREEEKVFANKRAASYNRPYDQNQIDFWNRHSYELSDFVTYRTKSFCDFSYSDTGLAVNFCIA